MPPPLVPPAPLHAALLDALTQPRATVPLSYFDVLTDSETGVTHTVLVLATDLYRRCTVNDGPLTVHSLLQRGCGSLATAEALVVAAGASERARRASARRLLGEMTAVTTSVDGDDGESVHDAGGGLATPLLLPMGSSAADARPIAERAVSFDAWLLRLCYVPRAALARLQTTVLALPVAPGECRGLPPAGLVRPAVVDNAVEAMNGLNVGEWAAEVEDGRAEEPWWRCECAWWRWW